MKKAIPPFTLTAGQSGRLLFHFTLPEGAETPTLRGALMVHGERVDMEGTQTNMLTIPSLPAGVYLAEVRAAGVCVLYGHVEVLPSPLFGEEGMATYRVDVDNTEDVLQVHINMQEGAPGPQGEQGEQGEKGDPLTYADLTEEQRTELVEPLAYTTATMQPAGNTEDNFDAYGFVCVASKSGMVTGLDIACRAGGTATPANTPVYIKIWRGNTEVLARSTNACQHAVGAKLSYEFEPFTVTAGEELRVTYHEAEGLATDAWHMGLGCCMRAVRLTEGETGGMLNSLGGLSNTSWTAKYAWRMLVERFAPAAHAADSTAHLTATEHAGLAELLARKEELLALLA